MKKVIVALLAIGVVISAVAIIAKNFQNGSSATEPGGVANQPGQAPLPNRPAPPVIPPVAGGNKGDKTNLKAAVAAAVLATRNLSQAQFLPADQLHRIVGTSVVPAKRLVMEKGYATSGPLLAQVWGYGNIALVQAGANYYVTTIKFHTDSFKNGSATFSLYTISHWVTATGKEYLAPNITVVQMHWSGSSWLYVGSHDPQASQMPKPKLNLSYQESVKRFQPYLKEFRSYESTQ